MSVEETKAVAAAFESAMRDKDAAFLDAQPGLASSKAFFKELWAAFPDMQGTAVETIIDGDRIAQRVQVSGTMQGSLLGMAPSGKHATWEVITTMRIENGTIMEYHGQADVMGMMQQLGIGPGAGQPR